MNKNPWQWPLYVALLVLYLLHNDLWLWEDATLVFGLPVGLVYHVGFSVVTGMVLTLLVLKVWPEHLDAEVDNAEVNNKGER